MCGFDALLLLTRAMMVSGVVMQTAESIMHLHFECFTIEFQRLNLNVRMCGFVDALSRLRRAMMGRGVVMKPAESIINLRS